MAKGKCEAVNLPAWDETRPDPIQVRAEVRAMAFAYRDAILDRFGAGGVRAVYFKGSGRKPWDSLVDYDMARSGRRNAVDLW